MTTTHTLSGEFNLPSGAPARGRIRIEVGGLDPDSGAWVDVIEVRDPAGDLVWTGPQEIALAAGRIVNESGDPLRLPAPDPDLVPAEWSYRVTAKLDHLSSADQPVKVFTLTGPVDWADLSAGPAVALAAAVYVTPADLAVLSAQVAQLTEWVGSPRGVIDHGDVSGVLALPATIGLQELTVVGDLMLAPTGPAGVTFAVRVAQDLDGGHEVTFGPGVTKSGPWEFPTLPTAELVITLVRWGSGWQAYPAAQTAGVPIDQAAPTAGVLTLVTLGTDSAVVRVDGAADETALHATPYRYTIDAGATWTDWQPAEETPLIGLDPATTYTFAHQTRDAAGNVTNGQPVEGTTLALTITDPTALGSCLAYFDASDAAKLTVNGGDVTSWAASGGTHSWTYTQDGAGTLPTVAQVNGKNAVALSADGARLMARVGGTVAPHFDIGGAKTAPFTVWQILKVTATGGGGVVAQWTPGIQAQMQATVGTIFGLGGHIVSAAVYQLGEVFLLALTSNATPNSKLYRGSQMVGQVNNAAGATLFGEAANTVNYTYVGANGQTLRATLCEFGFHMKELTVADLTELQNYATAKWGAA